MIWDTSLKEFAQLRAPHIPRTPSEPLRADQQEKAKPYLSNGYVCVEGKLKPTHVTATGLKVAKVELADGGDSVYVFVAEETDRHALVPEVYLATVNISELLSEASNC